MKIIICSEEQKNPIRHRLLKEAGNPVITGIRLLSLSNILHADEPSDVKADPLRLCKMLEKQKEQFPIFRAMFRFPAFIEEILSFAKECALYSIPVSALPSDTASERELAGILETALSLPLTEKVAAASYDLILQKAVAYSPAENRIRFEADPFRARFLRDLKRVIPDFTDSVPVRQAVHAELRYAPGVRQEIEACAQDIIRRNKPCAVVLCSYETQFPVVRQVFSRYGIPFSPLKESFRPAVVDAYISLARFALYKDCGSFIACLESGAFSRSADANLIRHFRASMTERGFIPLADRIDPEYFRSDYDEAVFLDGEAERFLSSVRKEYESLRSVSGAPEALCAAFEALRSSGLASDPKELGAALMIRTKLNQTIPLIETEEDAVFVLREIDAAGLSLSEPAPSFCSVTDLSHPCDPAETMYVLGCSGKAFPGMPLRKGLFDEAYAAKINGYPSLEERHTLWMEQLSWLEHNSDDVIYSYAVSDYQGREIQPSFDITSRPISKTPWIIEKVKPADPKEHIISEETARGLYEKDGMIRSSVSRIERWFNCPYSWFIQSGLKVREKQRGGLEQADIGTLQHSLMEHAVKTYGKDYCSITEDEIRAFMKPAFDSLRSMHPDETVKTDLSEERIVRSLMQTMQFLSDTEAIGPSWIPVKSEESFDEPFTPHVQLHGCIDRIDTAGSSLRILDYKSSAKSLSDKSIKAGLQLQLLSYLIIASRRENLRPAGSYYVSLKNEGAKSEAGKFNKTNKDGVLSDHCDDENLLKEATIKERRINGWAFDDPLISSGDYKQYFKPGSGTYSYETAEQCITELYEYFYSAACSGDIRVDPVSTACTFCKYKTICRYHLPSRPAKELVMKDVSLKQKKEDA